MIEGLDLERLLSVLEEMEVDDLADLLAEMPGEQRTQLLSAMDVEDADVLRRLLSYEEGTAGSLMTPDIIILGPHATVAEALAEVRDPDWLVSIAAQVFVTNAPFVAPTGTYLGVVHFQRLLREPPSMDLGRCLEEEPTVPPDMPERRRRRAAGLLQPPGRRRLRRAATPPRRDHRRRRAGPHPAGGLAAAPADTRWRHEGPGRGPLPSPQGPPGSRHPLRHRRLRPVQRGHRPLPRDRPLPGVPDRRRSQSGSRTTCSSPPAGASTRTAAASSCSPWCCRCRPPTPRR